MGLEKPTDSSWHGTFLLLSKLWILEQQKSAAKISIENDRVGSGEQKI